MRNPWLWPFVVIWFLHLAIGAGAGYAALRLWRERSNPFIWRIAFYLNAMVIDTLAAIVMVFLSRGVKFTWKFSIVMFAATIIEDVIRLPLIIYLIKGPSEDINGKVEVPKT